MDIPSREDRAWAAGFFDGEGCFPRTRFFQAVVVQADIRPIERFYRIFPFGRVYKRPPSAQGLGNKTNWQWAASNFEHAQLFLCLIWEFLSEPKREQAVRAAEFSRSERLRYATSRAKNPVRLTPDDVRLIRSTLTPDAPRGTARRLAEKIGVCEALISQVKRGKVWTHIR